jgi:hypothetical protein
MGIRWSLGASQARGRGGEPRAIKRKNPILKLLGLSEALADVDAAISQESNLKQLMRFRGLPKLNQVPPTPYFFSWYK